MPPPHILFIIANIICILHCCSWHARFNLGKPIDKKEQEARIKAVCYYIIWYLVYPIGVLWLMLYDEGLGFIRRAQHQCDLATEKTDRMKLCTLLSITPMMAVLHFLAWPISFWYCLVPIVALCVVYQQNHINKNMTIMVFGYFINMPIALLYCIYCLFINIRRIMSIPTMPVDTYGPPRWNPPIGIEGEDPQGYGEHHFEPDETEYYPDEHG